MWSKNGQDISMWLKFSLQASVVCQQVVRNYSALNNHCSPVVSPAHPCKESSDFKPSRNFKMKGLKTGTHKPTLPSVLQGGIYSGLVLFSCLVVFIL